MTDFQTCYVRGPKSRSQCNYAVHMDPTARHDFIHATWWYADGTVRHADIPVSTVDKFVMDQFWVPAPHLRLPEGL
mgnify:CR=1 FL=1